MHVKRAIRLPAAALCLALAISGTPGLARDSDGSGSVLLDRGRAAMDRHEYDAARWQLERAIVANPLNSTAFSYLGYTHEQLGNLEDARKYYRLALQIDPDNLSALAWSGKADVRAGELEEAKVKLKRLDRLCGNCDEYRALDQALTSYENNDGG